MKCKSRQRFVGKPSLCSLENSKSRRIESKHLAKSTKQTNVFKDLGLLFNREFIDSNSMVAAATVEYDFRKPN